MAAAQAPSSPVKARSSVTTADRFLGGVG